MKSVASAYINNVLPGQWLRKTFPGVILANSNMPEKHFRVCLGEDEISELPGKGYKCPFLFIYSKALQQ